MQKHEAKDDSLSKDAQCDAQLRSDIAEETKISGPKFLVIDAPEDTLEELERIDAELEQEHTGTLSRDESSNFVSGRRDT